VPQLWCLVHSTFTFASSTKSSVIFGATLASRIRQRQELVGREKGRRGLFGCLQFYVVMEATAAFLSFRAGLSFVLKKRDRRFTLPTGVCGALHGTV